jgi:hypothetical protein
MKSFFQTFARAAASCALLLAVFPHSLAAAPQLLAARAGELVQAPDLASKAELVNFEPELIPGLLAVAPETAVLVSEWPVGPGERRDVLVTRHEVYAKDAKVIVVKGDRQTEVPRSRLVFFWGSFVDDPNSGVSISVDPDIHTVEGVSSSGLGNFALKPLVPGQAGRHITANAEAFVTGLKEGQHPTWRCGQPELPGQGRSVMDRFEQGTIADLSREATTDQAVFSAAGLRTATVAFDTDWQLLANKFGNNTTSATNYVASLVATMNVMYNRDLQIQLLVGTTILRLQGQTDPYSSIPSSGGFADDTSLGIFASYWATNEGSVSRTVVTMLSGKGASNSASGIAFVGSLCSKTSGYAYTQPFLMDFMLGDSLVIGHEIGHNFGSVHTHCYSPPIDECFNQEQGCYSGTVTCPAPSTINGVTNVIGTIMSYCHLSVCESQANWQAQQTFHPRTVAVIQPEITAAITAGCIAAAPPSVTLTAVNPQAGAAGSSVTLTGSGFSGTSLSVHFGSAAATNVQFVSDSKITATVPAGTGTVAVSVADSLGTASLNPGYFYFTPPAASGFFTLTPCRILDTRQTSPLGANLTRVVAIANAAGCGVPTTATAVSINITTVAPVATGNMVAYPGNAFPFNTSAIDFRAGATSANNAVLMLATDGTGSLGFLNNSGGSLNFIIDVNGYFK